MDLQNITPAFSCVAAAIRHNASAYMRELIVTDRNATHEKRIRVGRALGSGSREHFSFIIVPKVGHLKSKWAPFPGVKRRDHCPMVTTPFGSDGGTYTIL